MTNYPRIEDSHGNVYEVVEEIEVTAKATFGTGKYHLRKLDKKYCVSDGVVMGSRYYTCDSCGKGWEKGEERPLCDASLDSNQETNDN